MSHKVETALIDFERYLQDEIPPSAASDPLATLMAQPPDILMQKVATWTGEQFRQRAVPPRELLLHALKKIYVVGELALLDREAVANYLDRVTGVAMRICPEPERDQLRRDLTAMRMSRSTTAALSAGGVPARAPTLSIPMAVSAEEARTAKQYALAFDWLTRQQQASAAAVAAGGQAAPPDPQAFAQLLTMAAAQSQNGQQLNQYLEQLRPLAGGREGNVFVILGGAMPSWEVQGQAPGAGKAPSQVGAMERIIDLAESPEVALRRIRELVTAAIDKFNEGALAASVWMLDVAEDTIKERKLDPTVVDQIRKEAVERIDAVQLRKYAETKRRHAALKLVLGLFPQLQLATLCRKLRGETRAEQRRSILGFIEAYGPDGRECALGELERELQRDDVDTYYLRNLIYLLHRISRESNETLDRELAVLTQASAPHQNIYVVKEAVTALGQIKTDGAVKVLITRLAEFEALLLRPARAETPVGEVHKLLDRIISALARIGTSTALITIARHGMQANPALGDTRARLAALSQHDLSFDEGAVAILLKALRDEIPGRLMGRLLPKKQDGTVHLIEALSGTRSDEAEEVFRDIAQRFPDQDVGRAASQVLAKATPPAPAGGPSEPAATLTGELEFFGLPSVMQSLGEMRATGMLTLTNKKKETAAKLVFVEGKFLNAQLGIVRGADALYQALERPVAGSFAFVPLPPEKVKSEIEPREIMGLLLEGIRRNDELQRLLAVVPDQMSVTKTGVKPAPMAEETDAALVREVWMKAATGATIAECERELPIDTYRVRRLVAHWLEQGALVSK